MKMKKLLSAVLLAALVTSLIPTFSQAEEVTYEEKDSNVNMAESFTGSAKVVYGQTPSFTVKIPKAIVLDTDGSAKYTVGVKGKIPSKYVVNVVPDETTVMKEENGLLDDITVDVTAEKTAWTATELSEEFYAESTENTVQMQSIDYGKFEGNLNFNISATMPVELKDASDEVKSVNRFVGSFQSSDIYEGPGYYVLQGTWNTDTVGSIFYLNENVTKEASSFGGLTLNKGYYIIGKVMNIGGSYVTVAYNNGSTEGYVTYLGESYKV